MKLLGRRAVAALIVFAAVIVAALALASHRLSAGLTDAVETGQFDLMEAILIDALHGAEGRALARAELVASLPVTQALVAAHDRDGLLAQFAGMFAVQKEKYGVDQAQFHTPPATSLVRLQAPERFGDDLSKFRPMVMKVNKDKAVAKGFAIARTGPAVFGVAPISDAAGNHVGSFEFGVDFGAALDSLKAAFGVEIALFVEEKPLRDFGTGVDPARLSEQNRVGRFIRWHVSDAALIGELARDADLSALNGPARYTRAANGVAYGVLLMPLRNSAGDALGVIAMARDFSASRAAAGEASVWQAAYAIIAFVVLALVILTIVRGFILRPLAAIEQRLAEKRPVSEPTDNFPDEIARLAARIDAGPAP